MTKHSPGDAAFLLAQVGGLAAKRFGERVSELGVSPPDVGLLRMIATDPGCTQRSLAEKMGVVPSRMVVLIDALEAKGLVERERDPSDRRSYALRLTSTGNEALAAVWRLRPAHEDDLLAALTAAQRSTLADLLERVAEQQGLTPGVHPGYRRMGP